MNGFSVSRAAWRTWAASMAGRNCDCKPAESPRGMGIVPDRGGGGAPVLVLGLRTARTAGRSELDTRMLGSGAGVPGVMF